MKGFYDQMLPRFMDKYGKRWGVKTGEVTLNTPGKEVMHSVDVTPEMRESVMTKGQPLFQMEKDGAKGTVHGTTSHEDIIHSENFKRWFGDWEKIASAKAIKNLVAVPQEKLPSGETSVSAYQKIKEATNKADGITVKFFHSAYKKIFKSDGLSEKAIPMLKKCFEESLFAYSEADNKGGQKRPDGTVHKAHPNISEFRNYIGKVTIDGQDHYIRFTVQVQKGENGLHSDFVTDVDVYKKPQAVCR
ncbi:MAG: hypothetical protein IKS64_05690 [Muribaculaceae bacterium]|nr:hypothetical protein [Muribaculaceae bacterium]